MTVTTAEQAVAQTPDFTGYATKANIQCTDGRTILGEAFAHQNGEEVPLVWSHDHTDPQNVLGKVQLENVGDGVRVKAYFNDSDRGKHAKKMVAHGDVKWLSIWANNLVEKSRAVAHGMIREVSLVLAGANPGATIDQVALAHSDGSVQTFDDEAYITTGLDIEVPKLQHSEETTTKETVIEDAQIETGGQLEHADDLKRILGTLNEEQSNAVNFLLSQALTVEGTIQHSESGTETGSEVETDAEEGDENAEQETETDAEEGAETGESETETGTEEGAETGTETETDNAAEEGDEAGSETETGAESETGTEAGDEVVQHDNIQKETHMNVFDQSTTTNAAGTLAHSQVKLGADEVKKIMKGVAKYGSLKDSLENYIEHTGVTIGGELQHGIENIEYLFPDAKALSNTPQFVQRRMEWVDKVLGSVRKQPFARIKTLTADITPDEARARGYIKGNMKNEEYFALSKRETTPQTVYKKQKLDRDDVIDIVDLDVIAWMKAEMKVMLDEEIAGAILIGDGRSAGDEDKIREDKIRPIASDAELYVTTVYVGATEDAEALVDKAIENRKYYKGTGSPTFFTTEDTISAFLTVKDNFGQRIYKTLDDIKTVLRCSDIVSVEVMDRVPDVIGIMVNLTDYSIGTDRGGQATMFDDFDIDYNKLRYLIETRVSGALTLPKSAIVFRRRAAGDAELAQPTEPTFANNVVTVPTVTGVTYKNADTNATLTAASPVTLGDGQTLNVLAVPAAGKYFPNNVEDQWSFTGRA